MPTVRELYELWADDAELRDALARSLVPRGSDWLFEVFAELAPKPGDILLDAGSRTAKHAIRLVREHGVRAVALDPVPLHAERAREAVAEAGLSDSIEIVEGALESIPLGDSSVDWIWCRDVLVHVDVRRGLSECARVLRPVGVMIAYVTLATDRLEPREAAELRRALALPSDGLDAGQLEAAANEAGFVGRAVHHVGSEWRERASEDGKWGAGQDLLGIARLNRSRDELVAQYGATAVDAAEANLVWGIYQLLGKLCPTVYVWERRV